MYRTGHDLSDEEIRRRYSSIAEHISMPRYFYRYVADLVSRRKGPGRLLDIGCGNGYLLAEIARRQPNLELWGLEPATALVAGAQARGAGRWQIIPASACNIPFASSSFDVITMTEVLEHMKEPVAVLRELARLLGEGGLLILTVPNMSAYSPFWRLAERVPLKPIQLAFVPWEHPLKTFQPIDTAYEFGEIQNIIQQAGLTVETIRGREFFPYLTTTIPLLRRLYARFVQRPADDALGRILPPRMGYRLVLQCRA